MIDLVPQDRAMLDEALARARTLVAALERQKAELDAGRPASITVEQIEAGRQATIQAIASAGRLLASLEGAARVDDAPGEPHTSESPRA